MRSNLIRRLERLENSLPKSILVLQHWMTPEEGNEIRRISVGDQSWYRLPDESESDLIKRVSKDNSHRDVTLAFLHAS